jgi:flagellar hook-length control protein FliK
VLTDQADGKQAIEKSVALSGSVQSIGDTAKIGVSGLAFKSNGDSLQDQSNSEQNLPIQGSKKISSPAQQVDAQEVNGSFDKAAVNGGGATQTMSSNVNSENTIADSSRTISVPVEQIANEVERSLQNGKSTVHIQLHPQDLGTIDIHLSSDAKGVGITIMTEHASTGRLLESQIDSLRQSLDNAGLHQTQIDFGMRGQSGQSDGQPGHNAQSEKSQSWSQKLWGEDNHEKYVEIPRQLTLTPSSINYLV